DAVEAIGLCGLALGPALFIVQCGVLLEARELVGLFRTAGATLGATGVPIGGPDLSLGDEAGFLVEGAGGDFSGRETHPSGDQLTLIAQNGLGMSQELGETTGDDPQSRIALDLPGAGVSPGSCVVRSAAQTQQSAQRAVGVSEPETTGQSDPALSVVPFEERGCLAGGDLACANSPGPEALSLLRAVMRAGAGGLQRRRQVRQCVEAMGDASYEHCAACEVVPVVLPDGERAQIQ